MSEANVNKFDGVDIGKTNAIASEQIDADKPTEISGDKDLGKLGFDKFDLENPETFKEPRKDLEIE